MKENKNDIVLPPRVREVDVPPDGHCLFWSAALALLLPRLNEFQEFKQIYLRIFGTGRVPMDTTGVAEPFQIESDETIEIVRNFLLHGYHLKNTSLQSHSILNRLVTSVFRCRVVDALEEVLPEGEERNAVLVAFGGVTWARYLEIMRGDAFASEPEIRAIQHLIGINLVIHGQGSDASPYQRTMTVSEGFESVHLLHVNGNHYRFGLSDQIYTELCRNRLTMMRSDANNNRVNSAFNPALVEKKIISYLDNLIAKHGIDKELVQHLEKLREEFNEHGLNTTFSVDQRGYERIPSHIKKNLISFIEIQSDRSLMAPIASKHLDSELILKHLKKSRKISEESNPLDFVVFIGNTGSGKSTMINALCGCELVRVRHFQNNSLADEYKEDGWHDLPEISSISDDIDIKRQIQEHINSLCSDLIRRSHKFEDRLREFVSDLREQKIEVTAEFERHLRLAIDDERKERDYKERGLSFNELIIVDERGNNKSEVTPIGHQQISCTFHPVVIKSDKINYVDFPGFREVGRENNTEREVVNSINMMRVFSEAGSVKVVVTLEYSSLCVDRGDKLSDSWRVIRDLFGTTENIVRHRDSILINVSKVDGNKALHQVQEIFDKHPELSLLKDRVVICHPMNRSEGIIGSIKKAEFLEKINLLTPIQNPKRIFKIALSENTASKLSFFVNDAEKDIRLELHNKNFSKPYRKLNYLLQLSVLDYKRLNNDIAEMKRAVSKNLRLIVKDIYAEKDIKSLESLSQKIYEGIFLDDLLEEGTMKSAFFEATLLILKELTKKPVLQKSAIERHVQTLCFLTSFFGVQEWKFEIQSFIEEMFLRGNQVAITSNLDKKAKKLFGLVNGYLAAHRNARYGVMAEQDFIDIASKAEKRPSEVFNRLKELGWLDPTGKQSEALITVSEQQLFSLDAKFPEDLNKPEVKSKILELFERRLMIDAFFVKKFMSFKENYGKTKAEVSKELFSIVENRRKSGDYKLYEFKKLIGEYFKCEKAEKYLQILRYLKPLDKEAVEKRYRLLEKIKRDFSVLDEKLSEISSHVPVGSIHMIPSNNVPEGYKQCNGQWLSVDAYSALYHVLRDTFGEQETETGDKKFQLPDYRGYFLRGGDKNESLRNTVGFFRNSQKSATARPHNFALIESQPHTHDSFMDANGEHRHTGQTENSGQHGHSVYVAKAGQHSHAATMSREGAHGHRGSISEAGGHTHTGIATTSGMHNHTGHTQVFYELLLSSVLPSISNLNELNIRGLAYVLHIDGKGVGKIFQVDKINGECFMIGGVTPDIFNQVRYLSEIYLIEDVPEALNSGQLREIQRITNHQPKQDGCHKHVASAHDNLPNRSLAQYVIHSSTNTNQTPVTFNGIRSGNPGILRGSAGLRALAQGLTALGEHSHHIENSNHTHFLHVDSSGDHTHGLSIDRACDHTHDLHISEAGTHQHTLEVSEHSGHTHAATVTEGGDHAHSFTTPTAGTHRHNLTIYNNGEHTHETAGWDEETRPKNYPVTYIIKC